MKAEDLINNNLLTNIEVADGETVVFTEIALTAVNMARLEEKSPWISVEERTPETGDDLYFVLDTTMTPPGVGLCDFDVNSKMWVDNYHLVVNPTHWMPIPE